MIASISATYNMSSSFEQENRIPVFVKEYQYKSLRPLSLCHIFWLVV